MNTHPQFQPGDKVVELAGLSRSVGVASALAASISYQLFFRTPDFLLILLLTLSASIIGYIVGRVFSMRYSKGGRGGTTTIVRHGRDGLPATIRTALGVALSVAFIFVLIAKFSLGFQGGVAVLVVSIFLPSLLIALIWSLLASLL